MPLSSLKGFRVYIIVNEVSMAIIYNATYANLGMLLLLTPHAEKQAQHPLHTAVPAQQAADAHSPKHILKSNIKYK